tara:strand:+ start:1282 stop:1890 length:609 start_codon:yes stop_codon:yes gene_type:complete
LFVLGITGGISSGKSEVAKIFNHFGYPVIDADKVGHKVYIRGTKCYQSIIEYFSKDILLENFEIDRRKLADIVFNDPIKLSYLQKLVWPEILKEISNEINILQDKNIKLVVLEAHILFEAGWEKIVNEVWTVESTEFIQLSRLMNIRGLSYLSANSRMNAQNNPEYRKKKSHKVIENINELFILKNMVIELIKVLENNLNSE